MNPLLELNKFGQSVWLDFIRRDDSGILSRVLLFDWWVRNSDRALTEIGGNPNLLWEIGRKRVVMIDHDNAFDFHFDLAAFRDFHALRMHGGAWDSGRRSELTAWLGDGLSRLDAIWSEIPEEWLVNSHGDRHCGLDKDGLIAVLSSFHANPAFWESPV